MTEPENRDLLLTQLRERMSEVAPLPEEPDFFTRTDVLLRFLKARSWVVDDAEKQLKDTVEWRREMKPLSIDCRWCHERPGYHCVRQVGFDKIKRPVIYACFAQAACAKTTVEDTVVHMTNLIANAERTMASDVGTWVFIMDCTGMTLPACNPRVGYGITHQMATYFPERLGLVICIHHNPVFQGVWNAFKVFLDPNTAAKMQLLRKKNKFSKAFAEHFDEELASWVMAEVKLNKLLHKRRSSPAYNPQREFWRAPTAMDAATDVHDPRGCPSYVRLYIDTFLDNFKKLESGELPSLHHPHPNIVDQLRGVIKQVETPPSPVANGNGHDVSLNSTGSIDNSDDEEGPETPSTPVVLANLSEEYQIPKEVLEQREHELHHGLQKTKIK